jgi:secondary thiamine-phosphate synthase enzyme
VSLQSCARQHAFQEAISAAAAGQAQEEPAKTVLTCQAGQNPQNRGGEGLPARDRAPNRSGLSVRDITNEVNEAVEESGITEGIACIYSPHTTCCIRVNEFETGFIEDFSELLRRLVPSETYYAHDDWDKRTENICPEDMDFGNGHSHCMAMLLGTAGESVPVRDG